MGRINTPLITINTMVRVGKWTVEQVVHGHWRNCDRCGTNHKETWVCAIDPEVDDATVQARLGGKRTWSVGSTCGPKLEMTSGAIWEEPRKDLRRMMRLAVEATGALENAKTLRVKLLFQESIVENLEKLKRGELDRRMQKMLRHHVNGVKNALKEIQAERRRRASARLAGALTDGSQSFRGDTRQP